MVSPTVIDFQMGRFDPPGTTFIPGLRENLYGLFTINLGVYVPEVARHHGGGEAKSVVRDGNCCIRTRLGRTTRKDSWWKISADETVVTELLERFQNEAFPLFSTLRKPRPNPQRVSNCDRQYGPHAHAKNRLRDYPSKSRRP